MRIEQATPASVADLWASVEPAARSAETLEDAAQALVAELHGRFDESVVIARVFVTVPFAELPASNQEFVRNLVESVGAADGLKPTTPVLSLIGSHGSETDWQDRRKSKGHVGIPLISSAFVDAIPMISRLLRELGLPLNWVDSQDSGVVIETIGSSAGLFFVPNATDATDDQARKIIAAQDFVAESGVKSVFGTGGAYTDGRMIVTVVFCRDEFTRSVAQQFTELTTLLKATTAALAGGGKIFAD